MRMLFRRVAAVLLVLLARASPRDAIVTFAGAARHLSTEQLQAQEAQNTSVGVHRLEPGKNQRLPSHAWAMIRHGL